MVILKILIKWRASKREWVTQHHKLAGTRITLLDANSFCWNRKKCYSKIHWHDWNKAFNMTETAPSDGDHQLSVIDGNLVYVYNQDASVLNGTSWEMVVKENFRLWRLVMKTGAPVIGLVDCAGLRSRLQIWKLDFWFHYLKQTLASGMIRRSQQFLYLRR